MEARGDGLLPEEMRFYWVKLAVFCFAESLPEGGWAN